MNFNTQLYLILSTLYFLSVSLLSLPAILKPKKQESSVESYSSPKNTCSTQPSSSRFNYKRADLTIIIPEDDLINVSTQGELILLFFKQNCFPFSLFKSKSVGLKFQKCTKLFLVISFNLCTSILLLKYSTLASSKPDLFIVGPLICCVGGLVFAAIVAAINGVKIEGNLGKLVKIIQVVLFFTSWVLGLSVNIWVKVSFT
jgi:hypothetical protein